MVLSYLVVMKHVVTAIIIILEFPCLIELEEESYIYYPCIGRVSKKDKRGDGELHCSLLPPRLREVSFISGTDFGRAQPWHENPQGRTWCTTKSLKGDMNQTSEQAFCVNAISRRM